MSSFISTAQQTSRAWYSAISGYVLRRLLSTPLPFAPPRPPRRTVAWHHVDNHAFFPQFDGEKDTRTPVDFSNTKNEEPPEEDDEGDDDDGTGAGRQKKDSKGQLKPKDSSHTNGHSHTNGSANVGGVPIRPAHPTDVSSHGIDVRLCAPTFCHTPHSLTPCRSTTAQPTAGYTTARRTA